MENARSRATIDKLVIPMLSPMEVSTKRLLEFGLKAAANCSGVFLCAVLGVPIGLASLSIPAHAASFVPSGVEFENLDEASLEKASQFAAELLAIAEEEVRLLERRDDNVESLVREIDGDLHIVIDDMLFRLSHLESKNAAFGERWPSGEVFYEFDADLNQDQKNAWLAAAKLWSDVAGLRFIPRPGSVQDYIYVLNSEFNASAVGKIGGKQVMEIETWSDQLVLAHEIAHALGMVHEHQRSGRSDYVEIIWDNIESGKSKQFEEIPITTNIGDYDFSSAMHYKSDAFAHRHAGNNRAGRTIVPVVNVPNALRLMGNATELSDLDLDGMASIYPK